MGIERIFLAAMLNESIKNRQRYKFSSKVRVKIFLDKGQGI